MFGFEPLQLALISIITIVSLALLDGIFRSYRSEPVIEPGGGEPILKQGSPGEYVPTSFEALGLHADATPEDVLAAYRRLALDVHPDHGGDVESFTQLQQNFELAMAHAEGRLAHAT